MRPAPVSEATKTLAQLCAGLAAARVPAVAVTGLALDSRRIRPGWVFLACRGTRDHGLRYAVQACERGAAAILYEPDTGLSLPDLPRAIPLVAVPELRRHAGTIAARFFEDPSAGLAVTGVTGTNGKTSVATILAQVLADWGQASGLIGTLGYGLYGMLEAALETTPDAVRLQAIFAALRNHGAVHVAMEVSSHALDQDRVAGVHFENAVLTNLTRDHLDYHGTMERYREAKGRLFSWPDLRRVVLCLDDPAAEYFDAQAHGAAERVGFGFEPKAPAWFRGRRLYASDVLSNAAGLRLEIAGDFGTATLRSRLIGNFNGLNLLAVLAVLLARGAPFEETLARVSQARTVPGRMETFGGGDRPLVVVDYAHSPDALERALAAVRAQAAGSVFVVFGCGGDRDRGKRSQMGAVAAGAADRLVLTNDNPRGEDSAAIIAEIRAGIPAGTEVAVIPDRSEAIATALGEARAGDVVLVAGKGHEAVQVIGHERRRYSDRQTVERLLLGSSPW